MEDPRVSPVSAGPTLTLSKDLTKEFRGYGAHLPARHTVQTITETMRRSVSWPHNYQHVADSDPQSLVNVTSNEWMYWFSAFEAGMISIYKLRTDEILKNWVTLTSNRLFLQKCSQEILRKCTVLHLTSDIDKRMFKTGFHTLVQKLKEACKKVNDVDKPVIVGYLTFLLDEGTTFYEGLFNLMKSKYNVTYSNNSLQQFLEPPSGETLAALQVLYHLSIQAGDLHRYYSTRLNQKKAYQLYENARQLNPSICWAYSQLGVIAGLRKDTLSQIYYNSRAVISNRHEAVNRGVLVDVFEHAYKKYRENYKSFWTYRSKFEHAFHFRRKEIWIHPNFEKASSEPMDNPVPQTKAQHVGELSPEELLRKFEICYAVLNRIFFTKIGVDELASFAEECLVYFQAWLKRGYISQFHRLMQIAILNMFILNSVKLHVDRSPAQQTPEETSASVTPNSQAQSPSYSFQNDQIQSIFPFVPKASSLFANFQTAKSVAQSQVSRTSGPNSPRDGISRSNMPFDETFDANTSRDGTLSSTTLKDITFNSNTLQSDSNSPRDGSRVPKSPAKTTSSERLSGRSPVIPEAKKKPRILSPMTDELSEPVRAQMSKSLNNMVSRYGSPSERRSELEASKASSPETAQRPIITSPINKNSSPKTSTRQNSPQSPAGRKLKDKIWPISPIASTSGVRNSIIRASSSSPSIQTPTSDRPPRQKPTESEIELETAALQFFLEMMSLVVEEICNEIDLLNWDSQKLFSFSAYVMICCEWLSMNPKILRKRQCRPRFCIRRIENFALENEDDLEDDCWSVFARLMNQLEVAFKRHKEFLFPEVTELPDHVHLRKLTPLPECITIAGFPQFDFHSSSIMGAQYYASNYKSMGRGQTYVRLKKIHMFGKTLVDFHRILARKRDKTGLVVYSNKAKYRPQTKEDDQCGLKPNQYMFYTMKWHKDQQLKSVPNISPRRRPNCNNARVIDKRHRPKIIPKAKIPVRALLPIMETYEKAFTILKRKRMEVEIIVRPKFIIVDTNCFLLFLRHVHLLAQLFEGPILVPVSVLLELKGLQKGGFTTKDKKIFKTEDELGAAEKLKKNIEVAEICKNALKLIDGQLGRKFQLVSCFGRIMTEVKSVYNMIKDDFYDRARTNDERIVDAAYYIEYNNLHLRRKDRPHRIYRNTAVATSDRMMRIFAYENDIPCKHIVPLTYWAYRNAFPKDNFLT